jgi:hypothetical protein
MDSREYGIQLQEKFELYFLGVIFYNPSAGRADCQVR